MWNPVMHYQTYTHRLEFDGLSGIIGLLNISAGIIKCNQSLCDQQVLLMTQIPLIYGSEQQVKGLPAGVTPSNKWYVSSLPTWSVVDCSRSLRAYCKDQCVRHTFNAIFFHLKVGCVLYTGVFYTIIVM